MRGKVAPAAENAICDWGEFVGDSVCHPRALRQDVMDQKWQSRKCGQIIKVIQDVQQGHPRHLTRSYKRVSPCWSCCLRRWPHRRWIPLLPKLFQWKPYNVGLELFWIVNKMSPPLPWGTSLEGLPLCKSLGSFAEQVDWPFWMIWFFWKDKGVSGLMGIWEEMLSLLWKLTPFGMSSFHMFHVPVPDVWMNSIKYRQALNFNDSSTI